MKYVCEVTIHANRETVLQEMQDREALFQWMKGLKRIDLLSGHEGEEGSTYNMVFETKKGKEQHMKETIVSMNTPDSITTLYEMGGVVNECINQFQDLGDKTVYRMEVDFQFPLIMRLFTWMMKGVFKGETLRGMNDFKNYVEGK